MYKKSFPKCKIEGELTPVEFGHMFSRGSIPQKCSECSSFFEGECLRAHKRVGGFLNLDFGPCDKVGSTKPVEIERNGENTTVVPEKCLNCDRLSNTNIRGYYCSFEHDIWKDFPRDLDWGEWKPDYPLVGLLHSENSSGYATTLRNVENGANVSKDLIGLLLAKEITKAVKLYRKLNVGKTIKEASDELKILIKKLEDLDNDVKWAIEK